MAEEKSLHRMPVADCGDYVEIPLSPKSPWQTVGYSRWASIARSVSSNPLSLQTKGLRSNPPLDPLDSLALLEKNEQNKL